MYIYNVNDPYTVSSQIYFFSVKWPKISQKVSKIKKKLPKWPYLARSDNLYKLFTGLKLKYPKFLFYL